MGFEISGHREEAAAKRIISATAINEVFADGQKTTAVAVEYDREIAASTVSEATFSVKDRTITRVYTAGAAVKDPQPGLGIMGRQEPRVASGRFVILELSAEDKEASTIRTVGEGRETEAVREPVRVSVIQTGELRTVEGEIYPADPEPIVTGAEINLIADDFQYLGFKDLKTGIVLNYSLYIPKSYDRNRNYPLLVFLHDRGVCSGKYNLGLVQGLGGLAFATPQEQEKHECLVLIPQYPVAIVNDEFGATEHLETTANLINSIVNQYSIDTGRIYATGQSMGTMALLEMSIRYPDMFSAMLLAAGQWNPETITALSGKKIWVLVSEGDNRAFEGMNACMASLEAAGTVITRTKWDGRLTGTEAAALVSSAAEEGRNIKYTVFEKGTVVPAEDPDKGRIPETFLNHMCTWKLVFSIEALRDWLFAQ